MSETDDSGARTRGASGGGKTLSLKRTETSTVRQSFSHGRSKAVVVEKKRARVMPGKALAEPEKPAKHAAEETLHPAAEVRDEARRAAVGRGGVVLRELTEDEKEARLRALTDAKFAEEEARKRAEEDASRRAVEEERMRREREAAERRKTEEESRKAAEEETRRRAELEAARRLKEKEAETGTPAAAPTAAPAVKRARDESMPTLIEARTYRFRGHSMSDPGKYRTREEIDEVRKHRDPIDHVEELLRSKKMADDAALKAIDAEVRRVVADAAEFARTAPEPEPGELYTDVYAETAAV